MMDSLGLIRENGRKIDDKNPNDKDKNPMNDRSPADHESTFLLKKIGNYFVHTTVTRFGQVFLEKYFALLHNIHIERPYHFFQIN
jgi:hypothetical protein